ncbi:MAG: PEGA domain-containing protein [Planctomycetota bacterium]
MRALRLLSALAAACGLASCVNLVTPPGILIASTPPGAHISVDGRDSGFVTPASMAIDDDAKWIELRLEGYATTALFLEHGKRYELVPWSEGVVTPRSWPFPLFLPMTDLILPVRLDESPSPSRIHVDLRLSAEE